MKKLRYDWFYGKPFILAWCFFGLVFIGQYIYGYYIPITLVIHKTTYEKYNMPFTGKDAAWTRREMPKTRIQYQADKPFAEVYKNEKGDFQ
jgi:hypothetical protein